MKGMMEYVKLIPYFGTGQERSLDRYWAQWPRRIGSGLGLGPVWPEAIKTRAYGTMRIEPGRWYWSRGGVQFTNDSLDIYMFSGIDIGSWQS